MGFKCLFKASLFFFAVATSASVYAGCQGQPAVTPLTWTINAGTVTVQRDAPVGTVLYSTQIGSATVMFTCGPPYEYVTGRWSLNYLSGIPSSYGDSVYNTNLAGVGLRIRDTRFVTPLMYYTNPYSTISVGSPSGQYGVFPIEVQFIKTGTVTAGTLSSGSAGYQSSQFNPASNTYLTLLNISMGASNKIVIASCTITTPSVNIALGDIVASSFTAPGVVKGAKNFNVGLNCGAGAKINVNLTATANADTTNKSIIALTGAGTAGVAKGVGVQILRNGTPLEIGTAILAGTAVAGTQNLTFTARYYQTLSTVTPGNANATGTLNLTYQ